jgi:hypothetical protein
MRTSKYRDPLHLKNFAGGRRVAGCDTFAVVPRVIWFEPARSHGWGMKAARPAGLGVNFLKTKINCLVCPAAQARIFKN